MGQSSCPCLHIHSEHIQRQHGHRIQHRKKGTKHVVHVKGRRFEDEALSWGVQGLPEGARPGKEPQSSNLRRVVKSLEVRTLRDPKVWVSTSCTRTSELRTRSSEPETRIFLRRTLPCIVHETDELSHEDTVPPSHFRYRLGTFFIVFCVSLWHSDFFWFQCDLQKRNFHQTCIFFKIFRAVFSAFSSCSECFRISHSVVSSVVWSVKDTRKILRWY